MKIVMSTPSFLPDISGESIYINQISLGLIKRGYEVEIFAYNNKRISETTHNSLPIIKALINSGASIIHSHHYGYYPATVGFVAAMIKKIPHIFGPYYHPPIYGPQKWLLFAAYHVTQGLPLLRLSDKVLPHTKYEKKMLQKVGAKDGNMELLPNIVDTKLFKPSTKNKENIVLFASHLIPTKGPHVALDIARKLISERNDLKFVFIGVGHMEPRLRAEAAKIDKKRIIFMKNLSVKQLITMYSKSKVMILPSYYEAFGKVLAESLSCETPVVSTRVGGIPEVIDGSGFLVDYGDWNIFKDNIEILLDDNKLNKKMGKTGRKRMVKNFDIDVIVNKLDKIYKELI